MRNSRLVQEVRVILDTLPDIWTSWKTFLWAYPISLIAVLFLSSIDYATAEEFLTWFLIATLSHISMAPFILYGRNRKGMREQIFLVLLMGFTRGAVIALLAPFLDVTDSLSIFARTINSTVAVLYWFQVGSILIHFMVNYRKEAKKMIQETILLDADLSREAPDVNSEILLTRFSNLRRDIVKTLEGEPTAELLNRRAAEIDKLVKTHLRPLSLSEWREGELQWARVGFGKMTITTLRRHPLPLWGIVFLTLPFSIVGQLARYGVSETLSVQSAWLVMAVIVRRIAERHVPVQDGNYQRQNLTLIGLTFLGIAPITFLIQILWPASTFSATNVAFSQLLSSISFTLFCSFASLTLSLREDEKTVFRIISEQLRAKDPLGFRKLGIQSQAESEYAQYLHAEVQSQLLACKLLLLKAAENDFTLFEPEVTKQILDRLEKINQPYTRSPAKLPSIRVAELAQEWRGLAEIKFDIDPVADEEVKLRDIVAQLIEEAVVNAIRHGKAKNVRINVASNREFIVIEVFDDGELKTDSPSGGLGTILFETFTSGWSISRRGDETVAKFSVSRREQMA
jgi:hypothetical protein